MKLGERIRLRREALGISQDALARKMGYKSRSSINKIELGLNDISQSKIVDFAIALDTTPAYLMGWDDAEESNPQHTEKKVQEIPILGKISAGLPLYADENIEGLTYTDRNGGAEYFALKITGDSMTAAGIKDNDTIIVKVQNVVENGEIAVVRVDKESATVKRFRQDGNIVQLIPQSFNPEHQMQIYDLTKTKIDIVGKVVECRTEF